MKKRNRILTLLALVMVSLLLIFFKNKSRLSSAALSSIGFLDSTELTLDSLEQEKEDEPDPPAQMEKDGRFPQNYFRLPVDYDVFLAGTFAELRANHFHAGIDIRTGGVEGKPIYAAASGYVSRINVSGKGYGKALYISHPNGYTTVYAHLREFENNIKFYVNKMQESRESYEVELYPEKNLLWVEKGQVVAYSGNTGGSAGPHLHFEIRKTASQEAVNPLLFGLPIADNLSPEFLKLYILKADTDIRTTEGHFPYFSIDVSKAAKPRRSTILKLKPGKYATSMFMKDYFRSKSENLGLNYSSLWVDGTKVFETKIETLNFANTRYINNHMEYCVHKTESRKAQKFYHEAANKLNYYLTESNKGWVNLEEDSIHMLFIIRDLTGRTDSFNLVLVADSNASVYFSKHWAESKSNNSNCKLVNYSKPFSMQTDFAKITLSELSLYFDYTLCLSSKSRGESALSPAVSIGNKATPLHKWSMFGIKLEAELEPSMRNKLLLVESGGGPVNDCKYVNGFVQGEIRDFGTYYIAIDTVAPFVNLTQFFPNSWVIAYLSDNLSRVSSYKASIDGKFMLMEFEPKTGQLKGKIPEDLTPGKHNFKLVVKDERGNTKTIEKQFNK